MIPPLACLTGPDRMVDGWYEEGLGLTGSGSRCYESGFGYQTPASQPLPRDELMRVRLEARRRPVDGEVGIIWRIDEWQTHPEVRAAEDPIVLIKQEVGERPVRLVLGEREGRSEVLDNRVFELPGNKRRDHALTLSPSPYRSQNTS